MIRYVLTRRVLDEPKEIQIPESRFREVTGARGTILHAVQAEERWDLVFENFKEFELDLLENGLEFMLRKRHGWEDTNQRLYRAIRRFVNFLATAQLYLDQTDKALCGLFGKGSAERAAFTKATNEQYEHDLGYRVAQALRNHSLHADLPGDSINRNSWAEGEGCLRLLLHTATLYVRPDRLARNQKFKRSVLEELQNLGRQIDIKIVARRYMTGLMRIHDTVRSQLDPHVTVADRILRDVHALWQVEGSDDLNGLCVAISAPDNSLEEIAGVGRQHLDRYRLLSRLNTNAGDFAQHVVTSMVRE